MITGLSGAGQGTGLHVLGPTRLPIRVEWA